LPFSLFSATDFPIFGKEIGQTGGAVVAKHKEFLKIVRKLRTKRQKKADIPGVDKINGNVPNFVTEWRNLSEALNALN